MSPEQCHCLGAPYLILYNSPPKIVYHHASYLDNNTAAKQTKAPGKLRGRLTLNISKWQTRSGLSAKLSPETTRFLHGLLLTSQRPLLPRLATLGPVRMSTLQSDPTQPSAHRQTPEDPRYNQDDESGVTATTEISPLLHWP